MLESLLFCLTRAASLASSFGCVTATTFWPLSAKSSQATSISGPSAGFTSFWKSRFCFTSSFRRSASAFARPGNFFESASTFFHWSEPRSLSIET